MTQHCNGSDTSTAISNLLLVTGNYMRPGTGAYPLRGHNNVQGASDHGSMPNLLARLSVGRRSRSARSASRAAGDVPLPTTKGLDNHQMVDAIHEGKLKCDVPVRRRDEPRRFQRQLRRATRSPSSSSSSCRTSSSARPASSPTSSCPPARAWRRKAPSPAPSGASSGSIRSSSRWPAAGRTGRSFRTSPTGSGPTGTTGIRPKSWTRSLSLTPMFAGVNYERLEGYKSLQWPVAADGTDQPLLYTEAVRFSRRQGASVPARAGAKPTEQPDAEFDLHLNNGRLLEHFHEGNLTYRSGRHSREDAGHVRRGLAGAGEERGIQSGTLAATDLALRTGAGARAGDRSRARKASSTCR